MPCLPHRIILTINSMLYMDAFFIVKQYLRGNNFSLSFEMIATTQFFVPVRPALLHVSFMTFSKPI